MAQRFGTRRICFDRLITLGYVAVVAGGLTLGRRRGIPVVLLATISYGALVMATSCPTAEQDPDS
jgi:hypothetical protein